MGLVFMPHQRKGFLCPSYQRVTVLPQDLQTLDKSFPSRVALPCILFSCSFLSFSTSWAMHSSGNETSPAHPGPGLLWTVTASRVQQSGHLIIGHAEESSCILTASDTKSMSNTLALVCCPGRVPLRRGMPSQAPVTPC